MNIIESIYSEPEKWRPSSHYLEHEGGARLWIFNGLLWCCPENGSFGIINRFRAWRAYRWWCITAPVESFGVTPHSKLNRGAETK